jgi:hypothetical protein
LSHYLHIPTAPVAVTGLCLMIIGCNSTTPTSPAFTAPTTAAVSAPVEVAIFEQFEDFNPCTGASTTLTYSGTAKIRDFDDHFMLHVLGTVVTTDGYSGSFNWTFVFHGDRVGVIRAHDMELSDATGQRMIFPVGVEHVTSVDGEPIVSFSHFSKDRVRCVGKPSA